MRLITMPRGRTWRVQDTASTNYPSVRLPTGERLHVFRRDPHGWEIWLDRPDCDFSGLCIGSGVTAEQATREAIAVAEAICAMLRTFHEEG